MVTVTRECNSVAECRLPKPVMRVRFPSLAPVESPGAQIRVRGFFVYLNEVLGSMPASFLVPGDRQGPGVDMRSRSFFLFERRCRGRAGIFSDLFCIRNRGQTDLRCFAEYQSRSFAAARLCMYLKKAILPELPVATRTVFAPYFFTRIFQSTI